MAELHSLWKLKERIHSWPRPGSAGSQHSLAFLSWGCLTPSLSLHLHELIFCMSASSPPLSLVRILVFGFRTNLGNPGKFNLKILNFLYLWRKDLKNTSHMVKKKKKCSFDYIKIKNSFFLREFLIIYIATQLSRR